MGSQETTCNLQETLNLGLDPAPPPPNLQFSCKKNGLFIATPLENKNWNAFLSQDLETEEKGGVIRAPETSAISHSKNNGILMIMLDTHHTLVCKYM